MATTLVSPGVQTSVIDDTNYVSAPTGTIPFILIATAENKVNQSNVIAQYTTSANAGLLFLETSQRSLVSDFGAPIFYPGVNGGEQNEYGLMTAWTSLGVSDAAYIMRAPIDLNVLAGSLTQPTAPPPNGTIWLDTNATEWGILQYNASNQTFNVISSTNPSGAGELIVITSPSQTIDFNYSIPTPSLGKPGDYAVVTTNVHNPVWLKSANGTWVEVGTVAWQNVVPSIIGLITNPTSVANIVLNGTNVTLGGSLGASITAINTANITGITAGSTASRLTLYVNSNANNSSVIVSGLGATQSGITSGTYNAPALQASSYTLVPNWNPTDATPEPTGSIWFNTSPIQNGANIVVQVYNSTSNSWITSPVTVANTDAQANYLLDPIGGGINIPAGTFYSEFDDANNGEFTTLLKQRIAGQTVDTGTIANVVLTGSNFTFYIQSSIPGNPNFGANTEISFTGNTGAALVNALNSADLVGITAGLTTSGYVQIKNINGGSFILVDGNDTPLTQNGLTLGLISNWVLPTYIASATAPVADPADGTLWYFDNFTDYDLMINTGFGWSGYRNVTANNESRGFNLTLTDPNGPIPAVLAPLTQSTGNALVNGDIWINTSDLNNFPNVNRYQNGTWVQIDNTDHISSNGIVFADARWSNTGNVDPATGPIIPITTMLTSNYLDSDAPSYVLYPRGTILYNTRRSGLNVKAFTTNQLTNSAVTSTWVSASGSNTSGVAYLARQAQRNMVVTSLISTIENSSQILEEYFNFNLMCCPGYPELLPALTQINVNRGETAFIISDSPFRLPADANDLNNWALNLNQASTDGEDGLVTFYDYAATYYPSGLTTDLGGNTIVVPSSFMTMRTIIVSDSISYPWFAPAGSRRGLVNNATSIGYVDELSGNFIPAQIGQNLRNVLYQDYVNPISNIPGSGIEVYGQKTRSGQTTELSRINVARLVVYLRYNLAQIASNYVFEPNDRITRQNLAYAIGNFLSGLQTQRAISDWSCVCDLTNNTPATIDANELFCDVAIEPITAAEFIYIPITLQNSGAIAASGASGVTAS